MKWDACWEAGHGAFVVGSLSGAGRPFGACAEERGISNRLIRGGNFNNNASNLLPPNRNNNNPANRNNNIGFRCAKTVALPGHARTPRVASLQGRRERGGPQSTPFLRVIARRERDHEQYPRRAPRVPRFPSRRYPTAGMRPGAGLRACKGQPREFTLAERARVSVAGVSEPGPDLGDDLGRLECARFEKRAGERHSRV